MRIHKLYTFVKYLSISYYIYFEFCACSTMNNIYEFDIDWKINERKEKEQPTKNNWTNKYVNEHQQPQQQHQNHMKWTTLIFLLKKISYTRKCCMNVLQFIRMKIIIDHKVDTFTVMECWWWATTDIHSNFGTRFILNCMRVLCVFFAAVAVVIDYWDFIFIHWTT